LSSDAYCVARIFSIAVVSFSSASLIPSALPMDTELGSLLASTGTSPLLYREANLTPKKGSNLISNLTLTLMGSPIWPTSPPPPNCP
jgi:hypothetical protein